MGKTNFIKLHRFEKARGVITVEASLVFPVLLSLFLILFLFLKFACINIAVNHAVNETVKQIAGAGYPISFLNDIEDEVITESGFVIPLFNSENKYGNSHSGTSDEAVSTLVNFITGNFDTENLVDIIQNSIFSICNNYRKQASAYITREVADIYFNYKVDLKYTAAQYLLKKYCTDTAADYKKLNIVMVELPESNAEYDFRMKDSSYINTCANVGYIPGQDDVALTVEYTTKVSVPLIGNKTIVTRHTAVEKAWVNGNGSFADIIGAIGSSIENNGKESEEDKDNIDPASRKKEELVYVTKTGIRYHKDGCRYLAKSKIVLNLSLAQQKRYTPCKVCYKLP